MQEGNSVVNANNEAVAVKNTKTTRVLTADGSTTMARNSQTAMIKVEWNCNRTDWGAHTKLTFSTFINDQHVWSRAALNEPQKLVE